MIWILSPQVKLPHHSSWTASRKDMIISRNPITKCRHPKMRTCCLFLSKILSTKARISQSWAGHLLNHYLVIYHIRWDLTIKNYAAMSVKFKRPLAVAQGVPDFVIYYALGKSRVSRDFAGSNTKSQHFSQIKDRISLARQERGINVIHSGQTNKWWDD